MPFIVGSSYIPDISGVAGTAGITGPTGPTGPTGATGADGTTGYPGVCGYGLFPPTGTSSLWGWPEGATWHGAVAGAVTADSIVFHITDGTTIGVSGCRGPGGSVWEVDGPFIIENTVTGGTYGEVFKGRFGITGAEFRGIKLAGRDISIIGSTNQSILLRGATFSHPRVGNTGEILFVYKPGLSAHGANNTLWTYDSGTSAGTLQISVATHRESIDSNNIITGIENIPDNNSPIVNTGDRQTGTSIPFIGFEEISGEGGGTDPVYGKGFIPGIHMGLSADGNPHTHSFIKTDVYNAVLSTDMLGSCCYCNDESDKNCVDYVSKRYCDAILGTFSSSPCLNRQDGPYCQNQGGCCLYNTCFPASESKCSDIGGFFVNAPCGHFTCPDDCAVPGACCIDGTCHSITQEHCQLLDGLFFDLPCDSNICCLDGNLVGACCRTDGSNLCTEETPLNCANLPGIFYGINTGCEDITCCSETTEEEELRENTIGACCYSDSGGDTVCVDSISRIDCTNEYLGEFKAGKSCSDTDICRSSFLRGDDNYECDDCPSFQVGTYYPELGGYFIGYVGEPRNPSEQCLYTEDGKTIGCAAGSRDKINAFGQIKKQIEKHTRNTWRYMPGQDWYNSQCTDEIGGWDDWDFSLWNKENMISGVSAGWNPIEQHLTPDRVYTYSLTSYSQGVTRLTANGDYEWGSPTESCYHQCGSDADNIGYSSGCGDDHIDGIPFLSDNQFLHAVWFPNLYSCQRDGEWSKEVWDPNSNEYGNITHVYSRSCNWQSSFGWKTSPNGNHIEPVPSHVLLSDWTDGWRSHPVVPSQPYSHFSDKIYGHENLHRRWILILSPTDALPSYYNAKELGSSNMSWGMLQNAALDSTDTSQHEARVVETTEYDGLLNTRMFDKTSINNNVWFVDGGFEGSYSSGSDEDAYNRFKYYWAEETEESVINFNETEFKSAYESMWNNNNPSDSCLAKISDINENNGLFNSGIGGEEITTGKDDWYIPSMSELAYINWVSRNTNLNNNLISNGHRPLSETQYWSSTSADRWIIQKGGENSYVRPGANSNQKGTIENWDWTTAELLQDSNSGPIIDSNHGTFDFETYLDNLIISDTIDPDEIRRASGNAHRMACQIFDMDGSIPDPYNNPQLCGYDTNSICKGMVVTPRRDEAVSTLRPVRRLLVYSADWNKWTTDFRPKPEVCRTEWKTTIDKWPNKEELDSDMSSDCS